MTCSAREKTLSASLSIALACLAFAGCAEETTPEFYETACADAPLFSTLPVDQSQIKTVTPLGNISPPSHTLPNDHVAIYLNGAGVKLVAPGKIHVETLRKTHYLKSAFRQGKSDYAVSFKSCATISGLLGHIQELEPKLKAMVDQGDCGTYDTADETVEACYAQVSLDLNAGDEIGTVGSNTMHSFDFGLYDESHENKYVNKSRYNEPTLNAVCPYEQFTPALKQFMLSSIKDGQGNPRTDEPLCGTMEIDVPQTAQGAWIKKSMAASSHLGDESPFISLMPDPLSPSTTQGFSIGAQELGARYETMPISSAGRVNLKFSDVKSIGSIYCYLPGANYLQDHSFFIALTSSQSLTIERVSHAKDQSPCMNAPQGWSFSSQAIQYVR